MENIGVSMDGSQVVAVKDLGLDYNVFQLITQGLSVDNIRLNKPVIYLRRDGDTWSLAGWSRSRSRRPTARGRRRRSRSTTSASATASVVIDDPVGTSGVDVPEALRSTSTRSWRSSTSRSATRSRSRTCRSAASDPALALNALSGGVSVKDDTVFVDKLALRTAETSLSSTARCSTT